MKMIVDKSVLVYSPPVNEATKKWGVYAIPVMWRRLDGKLAIRFNGMIDGAYSSPQQVAPDLYFVSDNNGESWQPDPNGAEQYDWRIMTGRDNPYLHCKDGRILAVRCVCDEAPIRNAQPLKAFPMPYNRIKLNTFRQGEIPADCLRHELLCYEPGKTEPTVTPVEFDFPERELVVEVERRAPDGSTSPLEEPPVIFTLSSIGSLVELPDGTIGGLCTGQNPNVGDRYCGVGYFVCSEDGGKTWKMRGIATPHSEDYAYGLVCDGGEMSLTVAPNGDLLCVTRMEMCLDHTQNNSTAGTMLFVSKDNGYTWSDAREVADSSVTPHIITLKNGVVVLVYGRPGVHFRYSLDNGQTFSEPVSVIGKTLEQELAAGRGYMECKYRDSCSYSNTFAAILDDNTIALLYNNLKYQEPNDPDFHKAAFVAFLKCVEE